jgi:ketosteroid isomerase-like protein
MVLGCEPQISEDELKQQIIDTDKNFSQMSADRGMAAAFIYYADERVIKPSEGRQPIVGKLALMESFKKQDLTNIVLTWEPIKAEASGNLGYTFGGYTLKMKTAGGERDTTLYGNYVSIWKRKKDGSWRYVLDTGNSTPGPLELK